MKIGLLVFIVLKFNFKKMSVVLSHSVCAIVGQTEQSISFYTDQTAWPFPHKMCAFFFFLCCSEMKENTECKRSFWLSSCDLILFLSLSISPLTAHSASHLPVVQHAQYDSLSKTNRFNLDIANDQEKSRY